MQKQQKRKFRVSSEDDTEVVSKAEHNKLKQQLAELKLGEEQKKRKLVESTNGGFQFPTKRNKIRLALPNFVKSTGIKRIGIKDYSVSSEPLETAGVQWKLEAIRNEEYRRRGRQEFRSAKCVGFFLTAFPPESIEVDYSFRILGRQPSHDLNKTGNDLTDEDDGGRLELLAWEVPRLNEDMLLLDSFLQSDGSLQVEVDFTFRKAGDEEDEDKSSSNDDDENGDGVEEAGKEDFSWMIGKCVRFRGKRARR